MRDQAAKLPCMRIFRHCPVRAIRAILTSALACTLIAGCASGPELDKYPRREIDRPLTLPKGVATWHIPIIGGYIKDDYDSITIPPIPIPLIWEQSLSDDWTLVWAPLPLSVVHQFWNNGWGYGGIRIGMGFGYGSVSGFKLEPSLGFLLRQKLTDDTAIEVEPSFAPDIAFQAGQDFLWSAGLTAGPLFQLADTFSLKPAVSLGVSRGSISYLNLGASSADDTPSSFTDTFTTFNASFLITGTWSFARQWDLRPTYLYSGLGTSTGYQAHIGIIEFVHFW